MLFHWKQGVQDEHLTNNNSFQTTRKSITFTSTSKKYWLLFIYFENMTEFFLSVFSRIPTKYGGMRSIFPVSILGKLVIWWKSSKHFLIVPAQENLRFFCLSLLSESGISCYSLVSYSGNILSVKRLKSLCQKILLCKVI